MSRKLVLIVVAVLVLAGGGAYLAADQLRAEDEPDHKIDGQPYVLPKDFLVNLDDGRYAKVTVGLLLRPEAFESAGGEARGREARPPEGYGPLPQEAVVRSIVTDTLTGRNGRQLATADGRERLKRILLARIRRASDVPALDVYFTDVVIQ